MDNKAYLKKILSANIHISDKNKLDESLDAMFDGGQQSSTVGGNMIIHISRDVWDNFSADKTYDEIYEAIQQGIIPVCILGNSLYYLTGADNLDGALPPLGGGTYYIYFVNVDVYMGYDLPQISVSYIEINSDNLVMLSSYYIDGLNPQ